MLTIGAGNCSADDYDLEKLYEAQNVYVSDLGVLPGNRVFSG